MKLHKTVETYFEALYRQVADHGRNAVLFRSNERRGWFGFHAGPHEHTIETETVLAFTRQALPSVTEPEAIRLFNRRTLETVDRAQAEHDKRGTCSCEGGRE